MRGNVENIPEFDGLDQNGTVIQLGRKTGSSSATGNIAVEFDASGANGVYFERDSFQVAYFDGDDLVEAGSGKITIKTKSERELPDMPARIQKEAMQEPRSDENLDGDNNLNNGRTIASISGENEEVTVNKPGIVTGKLRGNKDTDQFKSLSELSNATARPETTEAILNMAINDVSDYDWPIIIQARLVYAPLGLDNTDEGGLRPVIPN